MASIHKTEANIIKYQMKEWCMSGSGIRKGENERFRTACGIWSSGLWMSVTTKLPCEWFQVGSDVNYRLITAYLLLRVNLDKIMHARWDFDASSAQTRRVSALDKHQNWSPSALFCRNSRAQSKYAVVNLIHTRRKQTFLSFIMR